MLYKCTCNRKSNQQNLGTIKYFNRCTEIVEYYALDDEVAQVAVCNLVFIAVNMWQGRQDLLLNGEGVAEDDQVDDLNIIINQVHDEVKGKMFGLELSWFGEFTNGVQ